MDVPLYEEFIIRLYFAFSFGLITIDCFNRHPAPVSNIDNVSHAGVEAIFEGAILKGFIFIDIQLHSAYPRG